MQSKEYIYDSHTFLLEKLSKGHPQLYGEKEKSCFHLEYASKERSPLTKTKQMGIAEFNIDETLLMAR